MKRFILSAALCMLAATPSWARGRRGGHGGGGGSHSIKAYTTKTGVYHAPAHATNPDSTKKNNYSTKGNTNPYTGQEGTKEP